MAETSFWAYKGFKLILRFFENIFRIKEAESDEHKISISFFVVGTVYTLVTCYSRFFVKITIKSISDVEID